MASNRCGGEMENISFDSLIIISFSNQTKMNNLCVIPPPFFHGSAVCSNTKFTDPKVYVEVYRTPRQI